MFLSYMNLKLQSNFKPKGKKKLLRAKEVETKKMATRKAASNGHKDKAIKAVNVISDTMSSSNEEDTERKPQSHSGDPMSKRKGPPIKMSPRLPRDMWGTPAAAHRRRELQRVRQQRHRARRRAEKLSAARGGRSSEEDSEEEQPAADKHGVPLPSYPCQDLNCSDGSSSAREDIVKEHAKVSSSKPKACKTLVNDMQQANSVPLRTSEDELDKLAELFAKVKCTSHVSDSAMDKLFGTFVNNNNEIMGLVKEGRIKPSYSKSIRPLVTSKLLPIYNSVLLMQKDARANKFHKVQGLKTIPKHFLNLPETHTLKLLRMEAYVHLQDIKKQYILQHGDTEETRRNLLNCQLSVDGVSESRKGARTFIIVSMRISNCLYLVHSFNPLVGVEESKPTAVELLR